MKKIIKVFTIILIIGLSASIFMACGKAKPPKIEVPEIEYAYKGGQPLLGSFTAAELDINTVSGNLAEHVKDVDDVLYNGRPFTGIWSGGTKIMVVMNAAIIIHVGGYGTGWISIGKTDYGYFDYKIEGKVLYLLYHLNIANSNGDSYTDMGTVTINDDGSLTADIKVSLGSISGVKLDAREYVAGLILNAGDTAILKMSDGDKAYNFACENGVYVFFEDGAGEIVFYAVRLSENTIEINLLYSHLHNSSAASYTHRIVVAHN